MKGVSWGSLQARLGSQGDAQAMQAVRTARGNSFCVDCDAPSKRCYTGRGAHPGGEGAPGTPATPSLSPKRPAVCVCPVLSCSGPSPRGWGTDPPATLVHDPSLASLRSWPFRAHPSQGHLNWEGFGGQVPANTSLNHRRLNHRRRAGESWQVLTLPH